MLEESLTTFLPEDVGVRMGIMKRFVSIDRTILVGVVVIQAATIAYLFHASARDRYEKEMLRGRIERYEDARQNSSSQPTPRRESLAADSGQNPALPFFRAHAEMEKILASMFGASGDASDNFPPESSHEQLNGLHEQTLRMFERSFEEFRRAGESIGPRGQMGMLVISPAMDMREFDDCYLVAISLPRFSQPDLSVTLDGQMLLVRGTQTGRQGEEWQFEKRVRLPGPVVVQSVRGTLTNGVLRIVAPKSGEADSERGSTRIM
jgi:HSP20 family molecular chaperone IbpA